MTTRRGKDVAFELAKFSAKRDLYYEQVQELYALTKRIHEEEAQAEFIARFNTYDDVRERLHKMVEVINDLNFKLSPDFKPNYDILRKAEMFRFHILEAAKFLQKEREVIQPHSSTFKLPKIALPEFHGEILQWPLFFEKFNAIIHNNPKLDDLSKLHYLLGSLKGKALDVCAGFTPTSANYPILLNTLKARFHNKRVLADNYFAQMTEIKPLNQESVTALSQLIVRFDTAYKSLQGLGLPDLTDYFAAALLLSKIDPQSRREFETSKHNQIPCYQEILKFLQGQIEALSQIPKARSSLPKNFSSLNISGHQPPAIKTFHNQVRSSKRSPILPIGEPSIKCPVCQQNHRAYQCPSFAKLVPAERLKFAHSNHLCINCLSNQHDIRKCNSSASCKICEGVHHTLLHLDYGSKMSTPCKPTSESNQESPTCNFFSTSSLDSQCLRATTILPTAVVILENDFGKHKARFLIDSGSQAQVITKDCCHRLKIPYNKKIVTLEGLGNVQVKAIGQTRFTATSQYDNRTKLCISALVTEAITHLLPPEKLSYLRGLPLADPNFFRPNVIDGILGAQVFGKILGENKIVSPEGFSHAVQTTFGYIVLGEVPLLNKTSSSPQLSTFCIFNNNDLSNAIQRFWEVESVPLNPKLTPEEDYCEKLFKKSTIRINGNRYCVPLPFKEFPPVLGDSRTMTETRFLAVERKFKKNLSFKVQYSAVIKDYLDQGHLSLVAEGAKGLAQTYYIPHFAVIKESSSTPLRIVFDASAKTSNGRSLNDALFTGPKLQKDICRVLLSFRSSAVAFIADVRQMYRNILVNEQLRRFQRILWRDSPCEPLRVYELNYVVFGITSAPYLALRTIQELASDEKHRFPLAARLTLDHMYVDDLVVSMNSVSEALEAYKQLASLFAAGGFRLTKWASSSPQVMQNIPVEDRLSQSIEFSNSSELNEAIKVLGLRWNSSSDTFYFNVRLFEPVFTKRGILSVVARIWDPLGFLTPVILQAKLIIKELWSTGLDWDDEIPHSLNQKWRQFVDELPRLAKLKIPRYFSVSQNNSACLIGFADSSEKGYGAVIYIRFSGATPKISLLYAKSRVAPQKTVTLPKLELCAAVLLSKLIHICFDTLSNKYQDIPKFAFTDSTVTLAWIKNDSRKRETFVANRVSAIEKVLHPTSWYHVRSKDNVADCISRALSPEQLLLHETWLHGPAWLQDEPARWPIQREVPPSPTENDSCSLSSKQIFSTRIKPFSQEDCWLQNFLSRFSSWKRILRVTIYLLRFAKRLPLSSQISISDLETAEKVIVRQVQLDSFPEEFDLLKRNKICSSKIRALAPFIDNGILRVGGRLSNSSLEYDAKHPILLPKNSHASALIIDHYHRSNFHTGPNLALF